MTFSKTFPKSSDKSVYPKWEEIYLTDVEEETAEKECKQQNILIMKECIEDARSIIHEKKLMETQKSLSDIAIALFEKRASHAVFFKEGKAKEKFDEMNK